MADVPSRGEISFAVFMQAILAVMKPKRRALVLARVIALYEHNTLPENVQRLHDGDAEALTVEIAAARAWFMRLLPMFVVGE